MGTSTDKFGEPAHWFAVDEFPLTGSGKIQKFQLRADWVNSEHSPL